MSLNVNSGSKITEEQAKVLIEEFDRKFPGEVVSSFIGSANIAAIMEQDDCIGLRIYNGYNSTEEKISLVLVGVNSAEQDILAEGIIYDQMVTCPPTCPIDGSLSKK